MFDYATPRFKTSEVARAAGLGASALRNYFARGHFKQNGMDRRQPDGDGLPTLFSLRDALIIAVAAALIRMGVSAPAAYAAAQRWGHSGSESRLPAQLFADGLTVMVFNPATGDAEIVNADAAGPQLSLDVLHKDPLGIMGCSLILIDDVHDTVMATLRV